MKWKQVQDKQKYSRRERQGLISDNGISIRKQKPDTKLHRDFRKRVMTYYRSLPHNDKELLLNLPDKQFKHFVKNLSVH